MKKFEVSAEGIYREHKYQVLLRSHLELVLPYYCGYVRVSNDEHGHVLKNKELYDNEFGWYNLQCHGSVTYDETGSMETMEDRDSNEAWWIGFDCNHLGDTILDYDLDFCIQECKTMIDQIVEGLKEE